MEEEDLDEESSAAEADTAQGDDASMDEDAEKAGLHVNGVVNRS
jgi:hypothetical protein